MLRGMIYLSSTLLRAEHILTLEADVTEAAN